MVRTMILAALLVTSAAGAHAQAPGQLGIAMGYPASFGMIWHVSDRVAVRPELSLTQISTTSTSVVGIVNGLPISSTTQSTSDQWQVGVGASALFYVTRGDALRTYLTPRFQYTRGSSSSTVNVTIPTVAPFTTDFTSRSYLMSGSVGAQYALASRFAVYGELGLGYTHMTSDSTLPGAGTTSGHTIATRSGVGVILYFAR